MKTLCQSLLLAIFLFISSESITAQNLGDFPNLMGGAGTITPSKFFNFLYGYYGIIIPGEKPDEVKGEKMFKNIYCWVNTPVNEIGVRMISPPVDSVPGGNDYVATGFKMTVNYFDPNITLFSAGNIGTKEDLQKMKEPGKSIFWKKLGSNDNSKQMPKAPNGYYQNAMYSIGSTAPIFGGLYKISISYTEKENTQGSFYLQFATSEKTKVLIFDNIKDLISNIDK